MSLPLQQRQQPKVGLKTLSVVFALAFSFCSSAKGLVDLNEPIEQSAAELHAAKHTYNIVRRTYIAGEFIPVEKSDPKDTKDPVAPFDDSHEVASLE